MTTPKLLILVSAFLSQAVLAADIEAELRICAAETNDSVRLVCYDKVARRGEDKSVTTPSIAKSTTTPPAASQRQADASSEANFGVSSERHEKAPKLDRISAKVTKLEERPRGRLVMTLDNDQVWEQTNPDSLFSVHVGDVVTIKSGAFNSFLLITPSNRFTNVRRVQ